MKIVAIVIGFTCVIASLLQDDITMKIDLGIAGVSFLIGAIGATIEQYLGKK